MDVFTGPLTAGRRLLRAAAIAAARELGLAGALPTTVEAFARQLGVRPHRIAALADVLVCEGVLVRRGDLLVPGDLPAVVAPAEREGWWRLAEVIRTDRPLVDGLSDHLGRFHAHLFDAGLAAAQETAETFADALAGGSLLDLGGGAGAYVEAALARVPDARATLVDRPEVVALARDRLASWGDRVTYVAGDLPGAPVGSGHAVALLANVLHLHGPATCAALVAVAAGAVRPGGLVVVKDLHVEADRSGPASGLYFALNMALYTDEGATWEAPLIARWLAGAGLQDVRTHRLEASGEGVVVTGTRPAAASGAT